MTGYRGSRRSAAGAPAAWISALLAVAFLASCGYLVRDAMILAMKVNAKLSGEDIEIELNKSFVKKYMDRVSITTRLTIDKAMRRPNPRILDGDLHFAGRAPAIGLPVVAEIANGGTVPAAVDLVHRLEKMGRPARISGVWRIWAEHAGRAREEQGEPVPEETSENPGHVFEIHPVTEIAGMPLRSTFRMIEGFKAGEARRTFGVYEGVECRITVKPKSLALVTRKGVDNNVEFLMEVAEDRQLEVEGGRFVIASVRDLNGDLLVERLRLAFADDTPPERAVRHLKRGARLRVYGLPRINLAEIWRRAEEARKNPSALTGRLPYEIIVQGVSAADGPAACSRRTGR